MNPGRLKSQPLQTEPYVIPDDREVRQQVAHPFGGSTLNVPLIHRYNTRARKIKGHNLIAKPMAKIQSHRPPPISGPAYIIHRRGEDWDHTNNKTGEVTIHKGKMNVVIFPEAVNPKSTVT